MKAGPQHQQPLPAAARLQNVPRHLVSMPVLEAVAAPYQMGLPAVPAPVMAATTQEPAMKVMGCMMVSS